MFTVTSETSPLFLIMLGATLLYIVFAWSGIVRGRLPNMPTSRRGARVSGVLTLVALGLLGISFRYFYNALEFNGTLFGIASGLAFFAGIYLAERIPENV